MLGSDRRSGLVQIRQLAFGACDAAGCEADELAQGAREMSLVEVAGFRGHVGGRETLAQQQGRAACTVYLFVRRMAHAGGVEEVALGGACKCVVAGQHGRDGCIALQQAAPHQARS